MPLGNIMTQILKYFWVPIDEMTFMKPRELEDDTIASLGFMRENGSWVSNLAAKNKSILMAPTNFCMLNNVLPSNQLSDIHGIKGYWMQHLTLEAHQDDPVQ